MKQHLFIRPRASTAGKFNWYAIRHPVRAVVPTWFQCEPIVNYTVRLHFWGFYVWHAAIVWMYWDWAAFAVLAGWLLHPLFFKEIKINVFFD